METSSTTLTLIWGLVGLALLAAEMMTGTFVLLFFGISGLIVAALRLSGVNSLGIDILLFGVIGALGIFFFRPRLREAMEKRSKGYEADANSVFILSSDIGAHASTNVVYQGTTWTAVNAGETPLQEGQKVRITKVEGIKLFVLPAQQ